MGALACASPFVNRTEVTLDTVTQVLMQTMIAVTHVNRATGPKRTASLM